MEEKKEILIIEDHDCIRLLLGKFLSKTYSVTTRKDGLEGMAWLGKGNIPDLVILDMEMPRIDGFEFLSNIRSSGFFRHIPVLIVSGEENPKHIYEFKKLGINGFIAKPFKPKEITETIAGIFDSTPKPMAIN